MVTPTLIMSTSEIRNLKSDLKCNMSKILASVKIPLEVVKKVSVTNQFNSSYF